MDKSFLGSGLIITLVLSSFFCGCVGQQKTPVASTTTTLPTEPTPQGPDPAKWSVEKLSDAGYITQWSEIGGKVCYIEMLDDGTGYRIVYDGAEMGTYDYVSRCLEVGGRPACEIKKGDRRTVLYDGEEHGARYDSAYFGWAYSLDQKWEKLAYVGEKDRRWFLVYDGVEYGTEYDYVGLNNGYELSKEEKDGYIYTEVKNSSGVVHYFQLTPYFREINGKVAYFAGKDGRHFLVYDGRELGGQYDDVLWGLGEFQGQPVYIAAKDNQSFIVYGGQELGKEYDRIGEGAPMEVDGKLAYTAIKDNRSVLVYDGKEVGTCPEGYKLPWFGDYMKIIRGKIAYGCQGEDDDIVFYNGKIYKSMIAAFEEINGELVYMARNADRRYVLMRSDGPLDKQLGEEYDHVDHFTQFDGKLVYFASRGNDNYLIKER